MRQATPRERATAAALAAGVGLLLLARALAPIVSGFLEAASASPAALLSDVLPAAAATLVAVCVLVLARRLVLARALRSRVRVELLPSEAFDPSPEAVMRFASQLSRVRRSSPGWIDRPASGVRVELATGTDGLVRYILEASKRGLPALHAALGAYEQIELGEPARQPRLTGGEVARAELVLARCSALPLGEVGLRPDPLQSLAASLALLNAARNERATVALDLMPAAAHQRRRLRRGLIRDGERLQAAPGARLGAALSHPGAAAGVSEAGRRLEGKALAGKLAGGESLFALQLLIHVRAE
ncbi:MAG: hypothetical protein ACYC0H_10090, partial [Solirubrobacteraceae bacterium]